MKLNELDEKNFEKAEQGEVLLDFYAPRCGFCRASEPLVERLSDEYEDIDFYKVNTDENPELAMRYDITGLPTFVLMNDGRELGRSVGARGEGELRSLMDRLPEEFSDRL